MTYNHQALYNGCMSKNAYRCPLNIEIKKAIRGLRMACTALLVLVISIY